MRILGFLLTIDVLLSTITYIYFRQNFSWARTWHFALGFLLLAINMPLSATLPDSTPVLLSKLSAWLEGLWIAFTFYAVIIAIFQLVLWIIGKIFGLEIPHHAIATVLVSAITMFVAWGSYRAFHPVVRTEHIVTDKLAKGEYYKMVLLTDIHLGRILDKSYAQRLVRNVNALNPDLILISGDTIDEKIVYVNDAGSLPELKNFQSTKGVYLGYGNHEYIDDPDRWQRMLELQKINVLRDKDTIIDGKIKITGITDFSRDRGTSTLTRLAENNHAYYNILLDHQPRRMDAAAAAGYDLYLAGHTHTGQLFPNKRVTESMYKLDYGRKDFGKLVAITSAGYGFWGPPVRTENAPEIVVIELQGE